jgi:hypothetical protein
MPMRAEKFRANAEECLRLSAQLKDPELKDLAFELAAAWLELAEHAGRRTKAPPKDSNSEPTDAAE